MSIDPKKYRLYESCLIKSIRRGLTDDAVYWATVLIGLDKKDILWRRIFIHTSEDIGLANPSLPATIRALYENWKHLETSEPASFEPDGASDLCIVHAVMLMSESGKSRAVDNALTFWMKYGKRDKKVPDYAVDFHSPKGRRMGRDIHHFYEEAGKIKNVSGAIIDIWLDRILKLLPKKD